MSQGAQLELRSVEDESLPGRVEAWRGDRPVALMLEAATETGWSFSVLERAAPTSETELRALFDAITVRARRQGGAQLELHTNDPLLRDEARRHGLAGPLRGPLVTSTAATSAPQDPDTSAAADPVASMHTIQQLLPDIAIEMGSDGGPVRALLRRATSGIPRTFTLSVAPGPDEMPTRFGVPNRVDLLSESIARCIDTTIAIRRRFGRAATSIRRVSFDHADFQLLHGHHAGSADRSVGVTHMNASFASVEGVTAMEAQREQRFSGARSAGVPPPFNQIDGTSAHEAWHQIQGALEARRSLDGIELRRRLGEHLGVDTLEQAVRGANPRSPDSWQHAHARLVHEVSDYAATAPVEATAEMFKLWWCANGEPAPIVVQFGALIEAMLADFRD